MENSDQSEQEIAMNELQENLIVEPVNLARLLDNCYWLGLSDYLEKWEI